MTPYGFVRVAAGVPTVKVADVDSNKASIIELAKRSAAQGIDILVTPELDVTAYTCGDLFEQPLLMKRAEQALQSIRMECPENLMLVVGCPVIVAGRRYNCAVVIKKRRIIGVVPKTHIPNYGEFYEKRWFESGAGIKGESISIAQQEDVPFGVDLLFHHAGAVVGVELCEDLWTPIPPSCRMAQAGADIILNLSASDELIGKHSYLLNLISQQSARCRCGYVYASAGWGESSTDLVFAGNAIVAEDGAVVEAAHRFFTEPTLVGKDIDVEKLRADRAKYSTFFDGVPLSGEFRIIGKPDTTPDTSNLKIRSVLMNTVIDPEPFVPHDEDKLREHCEEIVNIQARGLMQRLNVIGCTKAVIGISGGLDSTLALLVTVRAFDLLGIPRKGIYGITMPGKATTSRTHDNAIGLMEELGVTVKEIPIGKAVAQHFKDITQNPDKYDITYENSQARERTQILMDYSNKKGGIVIGTGDMSELALGWCTYNGDHMSMYGVNASVPKTLVKHLVKWFATEMTETASKILLDIVDTPISPELVPAEGDKIGQKTEDIVGPYELHDFFLYHFLRNGFSPRKIYYLAMMAFGGRYTDAVIKKWLKNFCHRFFTQQFKRSCMPDGPKVGSVCLSPRGDWRMPSDASSAVWMDNINHK